MYVMKKLIGILCLLLILSCTKDDNRTSSSSSFDENKLTGFLNLYPLIESPLFKSVSSTTLNNNELVGVVLVNSRVLVFPYSFFQQYEIINVEYLGKKFAVSYCPITKSCIAFEREGIFRASGYLYNENLAPWDQETETIWSQMLMRGLVGPRKSNTLKVIPLVQVNWGLIKTYYSYSKVLDTNMVISSKINTPDNPDNSDNSDNVELPSVNELTYGIINNSSVKMFKYSDFLNGNIKNISDGSYKYLVYGNSNYKIINAFKVNDYNNYTELASEYFPYVLEGANGVKYDVFGRSTNGINLENNSKSFVAAWWAWDSFYENIYF